MNEGLLPLVLGVMLMQNEAAMYKNEKLTEAEKEQLLYRIRGAQSASERRRLRAELADWMDGNGVV